MPERLIDTFGRVHNNLRISVTDRCNIRCFYCMPAENVVFMQRGQLLSYEEIKRFVRVVVPLGVDKIRLTGGEPLVRNQLPVLVEKLAAIDGIRDIGLTTNGILLEDLAQPLFDAGLRRINVSLDALNAKKFEEITRRGGYEKVIAGIHAAREAGFDPVKINAVSIRGVTEEEIVPFGHFARESGAEVRFIEYMPLDADNAWERDKVLFASEIKAILAHPAVTAKVDQFALLEYFTFQNVFTDRTLFSSVNLLPAGCLATWRPGEANLKIRQYWDFDFREPADPGSESDYDRQLYDLFDQAVRRQLVSDVPVGAYLSGGMDSAAITAIAAREIPGLASFTARR